MAKAKLKAKRAKRKPCCVCHGMDDEGLVLQCDTCDAAYHAHCHWPMKTTPLLGDWHCFACRAKRAKRQRRKLKLLPRTNPTKPNAKRTSLELKAPISSALDSDSGGGGVHRATDQETV